MGPVAQFILSTAISLSILAGGSIAWPRITTAPRPKLLDDVHNMVMRTPVGQQTANVLGVSDEQNIQPINVSAIVFGGLNSVKDAVQQRVQATIVGNAVNELNRRFDSLPVEQKQQIQSIICRPVEP